MRITVWHNTSRDSFMGYEQDHPMLRVFSYPVPDTADVEAELWRAVEMFNADLDWLTGDDHRVAAEYRFRRLRSFSRGDGFSVLPADGTAEEFRISNGYELLAHDGPFPQLALKSEHGSVALGSRLTYMLPVRDDLVREGLFEIDAHGPRAAERAVAAHHGVPLGHVAITSRP
ncbi:hypothetical protein [Streptomyces sp. NBC_01601]|uniref:hypothetical protein n=1 Tax=Streptomyces sp. NBC_01601 TaxID=2975892 RepID=UPI002E2CC1A6|nr:hypothetical protein [Streptomyces sp. NBC_01601]